MKKLLYLLAFCPSLALAGSFIMNGTCSGTFTFEEAGAGAEPLAGCTAITGSSITVSALDNVTAMSVILSGGSVGSAQGDAMTLTADPENNPDAGALINTKYAYRVEGTAAKGVPSGLGINTASGLYTAGANFHMKVLPTIQMAACSKIRVSIVGFGLSTRSFDADAPDDWMTASPVAKSLFIPASLMQIDGNIPQKLYFYIFNDDTAQSLNLLFQVGNEDVGIN
jgi:hypothetical protein